MFAKLLHNIGNMPEITIKKRMPLLIHVLGWSLFGSVIFLLTPLSSEVERADEFWIKQALQFIFLVATFYFNFLAVLYDK